MHQKNNIDISIAVPVFNEEELVFKSVSKLIKNLEKKKICAEIIIINDGSNDFSEKEIKKIVTINKKINIIKLTNPQNYGKSYCIKKSLSISQGKYFSIHDSDLEYESNDLIKLYEKISSNIKYDVIYGSRYQKRSSKFKQQLLYFIANQLNLFLFNILFKKKLTDLHSCYKVFKDFKFKSMRFGFELEVTVFLAKNVINIIELPISYSARLKQQGKKIYFLDEIKFIYNLFYFRFFS